MRQRPSPEDRAEESNGTGQDRHHGDHPAMPVAGVRDAWIVLLPVQNLAQRQRRRGIHEAIGVLAGAPPSGRERTTRQVSCPTCGQLLAECLHAVTGKSGFFMKN